MNTDAMQAHAASLLEKESELPAPDGRGAQRTWWAIGDPQAPFQHFARILDHHQLLDPDGRLKPDVGLVSMGDHFDYGKDSDLERVGANGELILLWLAAHPPDQVVILFGNHDLSRVQELALESDESFAEARAEASKIEALKTPRGEPDSPGYTAARTAFLQRFPRVPTPGLWHRDYSAFQARQRALVQRLLLGQRARLAVASRLEDGTPVLLNHAGLTTRELELLGCTVERDVHALARALNAFLFERIGRVAPKWKTGEAAALDLLPLHASGASGREGHGLLYHRPSNPDREGPVDKQWEFNPNGARRYSPKSLPLGLVQAAGHSGHAKLRVELEPWVSDDARARAHGGLRTLSWDGREVAYRMGIHPPQSDAAAIFLIDGEMNQVEPHDYPLLRLADVSWSEKS